MRRHGPFPLLRWARYRPVFQCKGQGKRVFKTSTAQRAEQRQKAQTRKAEARAAAMVEYTEKHPALLVWLRAASKRNADRGGTFDFPQKMLEAIVQYGELTDKQFAACERLMQRDQERATAADARRATAPALDVSKLTAAFAKARSVAAADGEGVMFLKLRLDTFEFTPDRSNAAEVWVKEAGVWLGKTEGGKFTRFRACNDEQQARIVAACADPEAAARAYGLRFGSCSCCGRTLTNAESRALGIGPICRSKFF